MADSRIEMLMVVLGLVAWIGIFAASWQGKLGVSGTVSDGLLAILGALIAYRLWRLYRGAGR
jgi:hypothetical protein